MTRMSTPQTPAMALLLVRLVDWLWAATVDAEVWHALTIFSYPFLVCSERVFKTVSADSADSESLLLVSPASETASGIPSPSSSHSSSPVGRLVLCLIVILVVITIHSNRSRWHRP